jgi:hypothetical protein
VNEWTPDLNQARVATKVAGEEDEQVVFDVERYAQLDWEEDPAPGRPEMTGQWRLSYRDGTSEVIDLPLANRAGAISEARDRIARKLSGP